MTKGLWHRFVAVVDMGEVTKAPPGYSYIEVYSETEAHNAIRRVEDKGYDAVGIYETVAAARAAGHRRFTELCKKQGAYKSTNTSECILYRHFDHDGTLLYVGETMYPSIRQKMHRDTSRWFSEISNITIAYYANKQAARNAERLAIQTEHPKYNIRHNGWRGTKCQYKTQGDVQNAT